MTHQAPPERLKNGEEFGELLRAVDGETMTAEALARNAAQLSDRIAGGAPLVAGAGSAVKWLVGLALVGAAAGALWRWSSQTAVVEDRPPPPRVVAVDASPAPPEPEPAVIEPPAPIDAAPSPEKPRPRPRRRPPIAVDAGVPEVVDAAPVDASPPPASTLPEQLRLFEAARAAARNGRFGRALGLLDDLLRRFPETPLRADVELTRAEYLARSGRLEAAARALRRLIGSTSHSGRRGELLRVLGDVLRRQGKCGEARQVYRRALKAPLGARQRAAVKRGLRGCGATSIFLKPAPRSGDQGA